MEKQFSQNLVVDQAAHVSDTLCRLFAHRGDAFVDDRLWNSIPPQQFYEIRAKVSLDLRARPLSS